MKPLDRAWARALEAYKSPGFRGAYMRGARAAVAGLPLASCPYPSDPKKSWRAVYRKAWRTGHQSMTD